MSEGDRTMIRVMHGIGALLAVLVLQMIATMLIAEAGANPMIRPFIFAPLSIYVFYKVWTKGTERIVVLEAKAKDSDKPSKGADLQTQHLGQGNAIQNRGESLTNSNQKKLPTGTANAEGGQAVTKPSKISHEANVTGLKIEADTSVLDTEEWSILVKYDKAVQAGIETIAELDRGWHEKFAAEMLQAEPSSRKADEVARRLAEEHQIYWKLSERAEINEALLEVSSLEPTLGDEFRHIYSIVGDEMDVNKVVADLKLQYEQKSQVEDLSWMR